MLDGLGWTKTFLITGATSCVYALLLLRPAVAAPYRETTTPDPGAAASQAEATPSVIKESAQNKRAAWRQPETRLGLWGHQSTMATGTVSSLVWRDPSRTPVRAASTEAGASV